MEFKSATNCLEISKIKSETENIEQEKASKSVLLQRKSFRTALIGTFVAMVVVIGYVLVYLPNIELVCLTIFLSGFILGKRDGVIVGLMSSFIFCYFNPFGASPLPLLSFQLSFYAFDGFVGGISSDYIKKKNIFKSKEDLYEFNLMFFFGAIGAILTFIFDILSTIVIVLTDFGTLDVFLIYYIIGLPFTTVHLVGNTLGFVFILPGLIQLINKLLD